MRLFLHQCHITEWPAPCITRLLSPVERPNHAKRQLTWFWREPGFHWIWAFGDDSETLMREAEKFTPTLSGR